MAILNLIDFMSSFAGLEKQASGAGERRLSQIKGWGEDPYIKL